MATYDQKNSGSEYPATYTEYPTDAYGSPGAGTPFNPVEFIKKPQVILRILSWLFAVVVFGCISSGAWGSGRCYFGAGVNGDPGTCGFGTFVGVTAFLLMMVFLALDIWFERLSNALHRKYIVIADIAVSGVLAFLWFVCFCVLAHGWVVSEPPEKQGYWRGTGPMQASIAFSFFSIATMVGLTVLAVLRYRQAPDMSNYNSDPFGGFDSSQPH